MANSYTINNLVRVTGSFSTVASTTLAAAITDPTATSFTVSTITGFPVAGNYEILIDAERMWVTGGQGTTTWSGVQRGYKNTYATTHDSGAVVSALLGTAGDPTTVTLKVKDPTGTVTTYTYAGAQVVKDSTGNYHYDLTPAIAGKWYYEWVGTGAVPAQSESYFVVVPSQVG